MKTLVVSSLYTKKNPLQTCAPKSLQQWLKSNKIIIKQPKNCDVNIQEVPFGRFDLLIIKQIIAIQFSLLYRKHWEKLDKKLRADKIVQNNPKVEFKYKIFIFPHMIS